MPKFADTPDFGQVYLYFDEPDIAATMVMHVTPHRPIEESEPWTDDLFITLEADGNDVESALNFAIVLKGSAWPEIMLPTGAPLELDQNGCPQGMVSGDVLNCRESTADLVEIGENGSTSSASENESFYVVGGRLRPSSSGNWLAQVTIWTAGQSVVESGANRFFRLPEVGTMYLPETVRGVMAVRIGSDESLVYPPILTTAVTYIEMKESDRLEGVDPEPLSRSPLTWVESSASSVEATGSIVDMGAERGSERWIFIYGVIAGALVGFIAPALRLWVWVFKPRD